jgi:hypothetical protein
VVVTVFFVPQVLMKVKVKFLIKPIAFLSVKKATINKASNVF